MKRQLPLFLFMIALGALAFFSLKRVKFSANVFELLPPDLVEVRGMDWLNSYFSRDGQLIVTVETDDPLATEEISSRLAADLRTQEQLVSAVFEEMPLDRLALEGGSLLAWMWWNAPPQDVAQLAGRLQPRASEAVIGQTLEALADGLIDETTMIRSYDPLGISQLPGFLDSGASEADAMSNESGTYRLFYLEGAGVDFSDYRSAAVWLDQMKAHIAEWRSREAINEDVKIGLTGTPAFMAEVGKEMERDMTISVMATMALISLLFWIMHRQTQPLGWLIASLFLVLIVALNIGGLLYGDLSVMSAGFAAILMGLAVDYAIVLYREAINDGIQRPSLLRAKVGSAIAWAAVTTAAVFLSLNFSSLPGIAEMGNLVAIGIAIGALIMLYGYAWVAAKFAGEHRPLKEIEIPVAPRRRRPQLIIAIICGLTIPVLAAYSIYTKAFPRLEAEFHPFRIRSSPSMEAWQAMQAHLRGEETSVPMVITGDSMESLLQHVDAASTRLATATESGLLHRTMLPQGFLPIPSHQQANAETLRPIVADGDRLLDEIRAAGFSDEGVALTEEVLQIWSTSLADLDAGQSYSLPHGRFAEWSVARLFQRKADNDLAALGSVRPTDAKSQEWISAICDEHSAVASMGSLGRSLNQRINQDMKRVFLPMIGILSIMLAIVFRSWRDWLLAMFSLAFAACAMVILTLWTPLSWNSFNICGLPLLFGTGLDFGIHMIFALRRSGGRLAEVRRGIAKALLFCGVSSAIGFGSMGFASAHGLATLGQICAAGILVNMIVAVWLMPYWYRAIHGVRE